MPYDPKRPRPVVDDDAPAPVEAILDTGSHPVVVPDDASAGTSVAEEPVPTVEPEPRPEPPAPVQEPVAAEPASEVPAEPESEVAAGPAPEEPDPAPVVEPVEPPAPAAAPVGSGPGSDVPVVPAPEAPTANRAVMFASLGLAVLTLVALLLLRRRRRRD